MGQVNVTLNGRTYRLECGDGEEVRVLEVAALLQDRIAAIVPPGMAIQQERLLVMLALMIADDLQEARAQIAQLSTAEPRSGRGPRALRKAEPARDPPATANDPPAVAPEDLGEPELKVGAA